MDVDLVLTFDSSAYLRLRIQSSSTLATIIPPRRCMDESALSALRLDTMAGQTHGRSSDLIVPRLNSGTGEATIHLGHVRCNHHHIKQY